MIRLDHHRLSETKASTRKELDENVPADETGDPSPRHQEKRRRESNPVGKPANARGPGTEEIEVPKDHSHFTVISEHFVLLHLRPRSRRRLSTLFT